jgi:hypothetical protein
LLSSAHCGPKVTPTLYCKFFLGRPTSLANSWTLLKEIEISRIPVRIEE